MGVNSPISNIHCYKAWMFHEFSINLTFFFSFCIYRDSLGWAVLLNFLVYITIPVILRYTGILLGVGSFAIYINTIIGLAKKENYFWEQVIFWMLCFISVVLIFMCCNFCFASSAHRPCWINFSANPSKNNKNPDTDYFLLLLFFVFDSNAIAKCSFHYFGDEFLFMLIFHMKTRIISCVWFMM